MNAANASFDAIKVPSLDKIPDHWAAKPLKHVLQIVGDRGDYHPRRGRYIGLENIESWSGRLIGPDDVQPEGLVGFFKEGDILFGKLRPYLAKVLLCESSGSSSTEAMILRPQQGMYGRYFWYNLVTRSFIHIVNGSTYGSKMPRANWDFVGSQVLPVPPLEEQQIIAAYLDRETGRIDSLVERLDRLIALLTEKRQAVISHAVTKGLNPDAPMKDSGIDWLGEVPAHWEVRKVSHFAKVGNGSTPSRDNERYWSNGHFPWMNSGVVNELFVRDAPARVTDTALNECHLPLVPAGTVLIAITGQGKTRGTASLVEIDCTISQHLAYVTLREDYLSPMYLLRVYQAAYKFMRSDTEGVGSTRAAITCEFLAEMRLPSPPISEQEDIVEFIWCETAALDATISSSTKQVEVLKERRSALISVAVTGQIPIAEMIPDTQPEDAA